MDDKLEFFFDYVGDIRSRVLCLDNSGDYGKILKMTRLYTFLKFKTVLLSGCFDLCHTGHILYLQEAAKQGDVLVVGVNSDISVRALKGYGRPIQAETVRATVIAAHRCVTVSIIFGSDLALINAISPSVYVYSQTSTISPHDDERAPLLKRIGAKIVEIPSLVDIHTTDILERFTTG